MYTSPIFKSILVQVRSLSEAEYDTQRGRKLFTLLQKHTPDDFIHNAIKSAKAERLFPEATHCDEAGNPLYCLEEIAEFFGQTPEEAKQALQEMLAEMPSEVAGIYSGQTFRIQ
ncbi:MAG: hypothetical protein JZU65_02615 [Chlorobium sp.]|nr:hypothetical protein [Chlorobium sp.]